MKEHFTKLFNYNFWANTKLIKNIKNQQINDAGVLKLLSHIVLAEQVWMLRLKNGNYQNKNYGKVLDITECEKISNENSKAYLEFIDTANFINSITYKNSKGIEFTNTIEDTLTHVSFHSAYHRGQIAREIRKLNNEPVLTNYIAYVREKLNH